jgi:hypothetical protein
MVTYCNAVFNNGVSSDLKEAILFLPAHELLPLEGIQRLINNANKNVALVNVAVGKLDKVSGASVAIVVGAVDERHKNWGNLLLKLGCSALAVAACGTGQGVKAVGLHWELQNASTPSATMAAIIRWI